MDGAAFENNRAFAAITQTASMTVEDEFDDVWDRGQTQIAPIHVPTSPVGREHYLPQGVGRFGTFRGQSWRTEIMPRIRRFIRAAECAHVSGAKATARTQDSGALGVQA